MRSCEICSDECQLAALSYCNVCLRAIASEIALKEEPAPLWQPGPSREATDSWDEVAGGKSDAQIEASAAFDPSSHLSLPIYEALLYAEDGRDAEAAAKAAAFLVGNLSSERSGDVFERECASAMKLLERSKHFSSSLESVRRARSR